MPFDRPGVLSEKGGGGDRMDVRFDRLGEAPSVAEADVPRVGVHLDEQVVRVVGEANRLDGGDLHGGAVYAAAKVTAVLCRRLIRRRQPTHRRR